MSWCSQLHHHLIMPLRFKVFGYKTFACKTFGFTTLGAATFGLAAFCAGVWAPPSLAQTSPTSTFDAKTVDLFDQTEGKSFSPLDLIHQANLSREDPFSFFQRQQNNLNSEFSDFRSRQLEQLRDQGYEPPALTPSLATETEDESTQVTPSTTDQTILRINLPDDSALPPDSK